MKYKRTKTGIVFTDNDKIIAKYFPTTEKVRTVDDLTKQQTIFIGLVLDNN